MEPHQTYVVKTKESKVHAIDKHALRFLGSHLERHLLKSFIDCKTKKIQ